MLSWLAPNPVQLLVDTECFNFPSMIFILLLPVLNQAEMEKLELIKPRRHSSRRLPEFPGNSLARPRAMVLCFKKKTAIGSFHSNSLSRNISPINQPNPLRHRSFSFRYGLFNSSSRERLPAAVPSQWPLWEATSTVSATPLVQPRRQPSLVLTNALSCCRKGPDRDGGLANPCGGAGSM